MIPPKTIGQIAYEAYCKSSEGKSLISGATLPDWDNLKPVIKKGWQAAADAVVAHNYGDESECAKTES